MYEVLQGLIVFMCGRSLLKVLIDVVGDQEENPSVPGASAADYLAAMQKRLAAYQAGAPVLDLDVPEPPSPSDELRGAMARAISETRLRLAHLRSVGRRQRQRRRRKPGGQQGRLRSWRQRNRRRSVGSKVGQDCNRSTCRA
ncbi:hypothetical protein SARC_13271 [Sphaeroforma arctica JP610]|uniref:Uncharacterized protein n=1 Tax=Sphaeroforma arctica JP610 TaxID=667725 RepID=A0A0L0FBS6_9EUKA|nr:hypothetical protein SARC_13271 [Sphaeroforma arctica JP610]KNC74174.1 hypothetical protein SARC_13271 [Sphaeroforma arctica JP610]|eukprot:XP_014148076.1 hypothetical protein SARC_13271 [Sphaeroforma arctica JP610]